MATLVLTAVGSVFGPIGGAVGALVGQAIDGRIFAPAGRKGPRLQDLKVQTSSYGAPIPKLFGTMRVAGTVMWATDLVEHRSRQGGGKGRPSSTSYSYTASFAVLLSARAIRSVGRIWADGNLLRGAAGDWKSETGFRLHLGGADQPADPFIVSAEAGEGTPAYRGCAYAVFEYMQLAPFGNRIPSLTFEVIADDAPVCVGTILTALSGEAVSGTGPVLHGFAASGDAVSGLVETLAAALPIDLRDDGSALRLIDATDPVTSLDADEIDDARSELPGMADAPAGVAIGHYDPARDYQIGVQEARPGTGRAVTRIELAAALPAGEAAALAEQALARRLRERGSRTVRCGWARLGTEPGALIRLPDDAGLWRVSGRAVDREGVRLDLRRVRFGSAPPRSAAPGRVVSSPDLVHGPTTVHLLDLPPLDQVLPTLPRLYIAAAGTSRGWRHAALLASLDGGANWEPIGQTAPPAIIGVSETILADADAALFDTVNSVDVALLQSGMLLADADRARLLTGANLALLGDELIQFGTAVPLGGDRWRLGDLVRGRRGTGWATTSHVAGERFVLIEPDSMLAYDPPTEARGGEIRLLATGIGDTAPAEARAVSIGAALQPPAPVHFGAHRRADGGFDLRWIRSSRLGFAWLDGADAPLAEEAEAYRLSIAPGSGPARLHDLNDSRFTYAAADVAADALLGTSVTLTVVQVSAGGTSRPAQLTLSI